MITPAELAEYAKVMKAESISSFKAEGIEITLSPMASIGQIVQNSPPPREYSDEELLFAATDGLPD